MPAEPAASSLVGLPTVGRRYAGTVEVRLGDTDPGGRLRLDALGRFLQDVANDDARDADLPNAAGWVVRRTLVQVEHPARLAERLALTTFCAGTGRSWAERRTTITGDEGAAVEAVSLWVQVDPVSGRPRALDEEFHARYGPAAAGRRVSARLSLPGPDPAARQRPWPVRAADLDVFGHANNAVQLAILEELVGPSDDRCGVAEIEYLAPLDHVVADLLWVSAPPPPGPNATGPPPRLEAAPAVAAWLVVVPSDDPGGDGPGSGTPAAQNEAAPAVAAWLVVGGQVRTAARWSPT